MVTDDECVSYARDCERLAGLTTDSELRECLLRMARDWMAMSFARGRGAQSQPIGTSQSIGTRGDVNFRALGPKF
jgi:hypothetical protein